MAPLGLVLDRHASAFVRPPRQRLAEVRSEYRMRDFMLEHAVDQAGLRAVDRPIEAETLALVENKTGRAVIFAFNIRSDDARLLPLGQLVAEPIPRELRAVGLGSIANALLPLRAWRSDGKVCGLIDGAGRPAEKR